ncbi:MAG: RHS repeat protein, partial [Burkholderiaceae bacterium]|nr:RHS repeat protein [Burkholderiaceae bacterium]
MVALISGKNLGLADSSQKVLGLTQGDPTVGRSGEKAWVNVASGNLLVQQQDENLVGQGLDINVLRTYNSQGAANSDGDNNDNWRIGFYRQIKSLKYGTVNSSGTAITRVDQDGSEFVYSYDVASGKYIRKDGTGSFDTLAYSTSTSKWTWTDGDSRVTESYSWSRGVGKLLTTKDLDGNTLTYTYSGALLASVTNAKSEKTILSYTGSNLTQVRTVKSDGTTIDTRTRYGYDSSNRLSSVTVDLSPEDSAIADGKTYVTTYTYDGTSKRVAGITQTDGTSLSFAYTLAGSTYRVSSMTQTAATGVTRTTSFAWDAPTRKATVTDPLGNVTVYTHDASLHLTNILAPAVGGVSQSTSYVWDANGNITSMTDARGSLTAYTYDANGNQTLSRDAAGNTVTKTYGSRNELLTSTAYLTRDPDGAGAGVASAPVTTRYAYDAKNHLRFTISPEGRVSEYRYNAPGQRTTAIDYAGNVYPVAGLSVTAALSEASLNAWRDSTSTPVDKTRTVRADTSYDFRGQVSAVTTYQSVDAEGNGVATSGNTTRYVYDPAGNLLQTVAPKGVATTTVANDFVTQYFYDGLSRAYKTIDSLGAVTLTQYDDANNKTITTLASGLVTTSSYNQAGELISTVQSGAAMLTGTTTYSFDKVGHLKRAIDPRGAASFCLYDAAGRKVADIDALGYLTQYQYNANNQAVNATRYAGAVTAANITALNVDAAAGTSTVTLAAVRPTTGAADGTTWSLYDAAGRLAKSIDQLGYVTETQYDGAGQAIATLRYNNALTAANLATLTPATGPGDVNTVPASAATAFSRTRYFYDRDGNKAGVLDPVGSLTENAFDAAKNLVRSTKYSTTAASSYWASGTLAQLRPAASTADGVTRYQYNDSNQLIFEVDGMGAVTGYAYDANGNVLQKTAYANPATAQLSGRYIRIYHNDQQAMNGLRSVISLTELEVWKNGQNIALNKGATVDADVGGKDDQFNSTSALTNATDAGGNWNGKAGADSNLAWVDSSAGNSTNYIQLDLGSVQSFDLIKLFGRPETSESRNLRIYVFSTLPDAATAKATLEADRNVWRSDADIVDASASVFTQQPGAATSLADRVTRYEYDAAGRQIKTIYPPVGIYAAESDSALLANGANSLAGRTEATQTLFTQAWYDAQGNIVANRDAGGNMRFQAYGKDNLLAFSIDAEGQVTGREYDALDNLTVLRRYALSIAQNVRDGWGTHAPSVGTVAGLVAGMASRAVLTDYDTAGRAVRVTEPQVFNHRSGGSTFTASPVTETVYDAFGRAQQTWVKSDTNAWDVTYHYYDVRDQEVGTVDALGFLTTQAYDVFGNLTQRKEFANVAASWSATSFTAASASNNDRTTGYTWDLSNRKITEKRLNVEYTETASTSGVTLYEQGDYLGAALPLAVGVWPLSLLGLNDMLSSIRVSAGWQVTLYENADGTGRSRVVTADVAFLSDFNDAVSAVGITNTLRADMTYGFAYDAFGNLIRQTDASGAVTTTEFDRANRICASVSPTTTSYGYGG